MHVLPNLVTFDVHTYVHTCVMSFSKITDPDHVISDHYYYDGYTECSYHCSNGYCIVIAITIVYSAHI